MEVDPAKFPYGHDGLPGSILDIATGHRMGLDHACGGVCACSTCHVIVHSGLDSCNEASDAELDQLDEAPGLEAKSRLGCQCVPDGTADIDRGNSGVESQLRERGGTLRRNTG